jgi:N-acetylglutamate synthase/N-acetylornithine aminotransferase
MDQTSKDFSTMDTLTLWATAQTALAQGRLREAKAALDELGLRFDDAYERLEAKIADSAPGAGKVWS